MSQRPNSCRRCDSLNREVDKEHIGFRLICAYCHACACDNCFKTFPKRNDSPIPATVSGTADKKLSALIADCFPASWIANRSPSNKEVQ